MVRQEEGTPRETGSTEKGTIEKTGHLVSSLQEDLQLLSTYKHFFFFLFEITVKPMTRVQEVLACPCHFPSWSSPYSLTV